MNRPVSIESSHLFRRAVVSAIACAAIGPLALSPTPALSQPPTGAAAPCTLVAKAQPARPLPKELLGLAGQYFHPTHRGMFLDLLAGTSRYAYYDPREPFARVVPPPALSRVERVTEHFLIGTGLQSREETVVVHRATGATTMVRGGARLHVDDALETRGGDLWILGETVDSQGRAGPLLLLRGDNKLPPQTLTRESTRTWWGAALGATRQGELAAAWSESDAGLGRLALRLAWVDAAGRAQPAREADAVILPPSYTRLALRTGTNVTLAADGDQLALQWRPLDPPIHAADTGDAGHPPTTPFAATVRLLTATASGARLVSHYATMVLPLGGTTGIGPWGLAPGGAFSMTLAGHAVFLWLDATAAGTLSLLAARPQDARPTVLVSDGADALWVPHESTGERAILYAYRSAPDFRAFEVGCQK